MKLSNLQKELPLVHPIPSSVKTSTYIPEGFLGKTFGSKTVVRFSHCVAPYHRFWFVKCKCGKERLYREDYIKGDVMACQECRRVRIAESKGPRKCSCCKVLLTRSSFSKDVHTTDGISRYCKVCAKHKARNVRVAMARRSEQDIKRPAIKKCNACHVTKDSVEFCSDKTQPDGLARSCSWCNSARTRNWYNRVGRSKRLLIQRVARYKITNSDLELMLQKQENRCSLCRRQFKHRRDYAIDHDHKNNRVRSLLCNSCNSGLGMFRDDVDLLRSAIEYLTAHSKHIPLDSSSPAV